MTFPVPLHDLDSFIRACEVNLRRPALMWDGERTVASFAPDLSPDEATTYQRLLRLHRSRLGVTPAEFAALEPDIDGLRSYHALASPTAAQTALATKAVIRVLRAILD